MAKNVETPLNFCRHLNSIWLQNAQDYRVAERTIVVNVAAGDARIGTGEPVKNLRSKTSTILQNVTLTGESLILIQVQDPTNIGSCVLEEGWHHLGDNMDFPRTTPLYLSPQFDVGTSKFDPSHFCGQSASPDRSKQQTYKVKVNVWWAPGKTNCAIHNHADDPRMLEVHCQIYGTGRMQKFHQKDFDTLFEDVILSPGQTHTPFAAVRENGDLYYPWHQYYSDDNCIWMAIEYHRVD